jgi:phage terminase small subunit
MARPRLPAATLELRGAFVAHPARRRADLPGAGAWDPEPPAFLTASEREAWLELLPLLPAAALAGSDRFAVTQAARLWAALRDTPPADAGFKRLDDALRAWCVQLGMTPASRARLGAAAADTARIENPFDAFRVGGAAFDRFPS